MANCLVGVELAEKEWQKTKTVLLCRKAPICLPLLRHYVPPNNSFFGIFSTVHNRSFSAASSSALKIRSDAEVKPHGRFPRLFVEGMADIDANGSYG